VGLAAKHRNAQKNRADQAVPVLCLKSRHFIVVFADELVGTD